MESARTLHSNWKGVAENIQHERGHEHIPRSDEDEAGQDHLKLIKVKNILVRSGGHMLGNNAVPCARGAD
jgi:hypothetical protein